jgi:hypothetical protein
MNSKSRDPRVTVRREIRKPYFRNSSRLRRILSFKNNSREARERRRMKKIPGISLMVDWRVWGLVRVSVGWV